MTPLLNRLYKTEAFVKLQNDNKAIFDSVDVRMKDLILANKKTWWGPFLMMDQMYDFSEEQKIMFDEFSSKAQESYYGKLLKTELNTQKGKTKTHYIA